MKKANNSTAVADTQSHLTSEYTLSLYITGGSANSMRAVTNIKEICEMHLPGRYSLEIIDVIKHPGIARELQIIALPLLIKTHPSPQRRMIGDMSHTSSVLKGLGIEI